MQNVAISPCCLLLIVLQSATNCTRSLCRCALLTSQNQINGIIANSPSGTRRRLRMQKNVSTTETSGENIKWLFQISRQFRESHFSRSRIGRVMSSEELGTIPKNNIRGITLGKRPIGGIHSLTLITSRVSRTTGATQTTYPRRKRNQQTDF